MIDTKALRRLAQAATPGPWKMLPVGDGRQKFAVADSEFLSILTVADEGGATFGTVHDDADAKFIAAANPAAISELLDRLEAAEKERDAAELMSLALRAKIAEMERQEPVAWGAFYFGGKLNGKLYSQCDTEAQIDMYIADRHQSDDSNTFRKAPLYALPGAKGEEK